MASLKSPLPYMRLICILICWVYCMIISVESTVFFFLIDISIMGWKHDFEIYREMTRKRIQIKKIDNINARQVTFSKRRRGLFKKAQELSTLCDAEIALIVFSATSKLFQYSSSSMQQVIERHNRHSTIQRLDNPSIEQQLESDSYDMLRKEVEDRTHELSQLNGEELQGLTIEELQKLEEVLERGWTTVSKVKDERIMQEINTLKKKEVKLMEENQKLKQSFVQEQRQSYESITCSSSDLPLDCGSSDTSLKLGLPLFK